MNVLLISTQDIVGGAARAAYRLHQGLRKIGINSQLLVQEKFHDDGTILAPRIKLSQGIAKAKFTLETMPLKLYPRRQPTTFSLQWLPDSILPKVTKIAPDIINLHWISGAFMQIETIAKLKRPLIWTLHDMWAFTGGCHYSGDCDRYTASCGACPQLNSSSGWDLSRWIWKRKAKTFQDLNLTVVTPSLWLAKRASASSLFRNVRIEVIPYGLDTEKYRPIDRQLAREILRLPADKQLILFASLKATSDKRKGFHLLQSALQNLSQFGWNDKLELVIVGAAQVENPPQLGFKTHYLGTLNDDISLALVYSAADIFVLPSLQDNLPNTLLEAIACGTPCLAFNIGGMPDIIEHQKNGYLAQPYNIEDFTQGIVWLLENKQRHQKLSQRAREKAQQEFTLEIQALRYSSVYSEVIGKVNFSKPNFSRNEK
jgi:glycosyltransferase involved in cell wall biosynthesis